MLQMRKDIADKFKQNLTIDNSNDSEAIKMTKEAIYTGILLVTNLIIQILMKKYEMITIIK